MVGCRRSRMMAFIWRTSSGRRWACSTRGILRIYRPAIQDEDGEVTLVHSVALTPNGKVEGLEFFNAVLKTQENGTAQPKELEEKALTLLSVARLLELPETSDEKTVLEKLAERLKESDGERRETITALNAHIKTLEENLKRAADDEQVAERARMVTSLSAEGKSPRHEDGAAYSREELLALDLATLKLLRANTPATVPLSREQPDKPN